MFNAIKRDAVSISGLTIEPNKGSINPLSSVTIKIEFQPMLLGAYEIRFELQVYYIISHII